MKQSKILFKDFKKNSPLLVLCLPAIIKIFIFSYLPMFGVIIAFKNYRFVDGILGSKWVGLKNFEFFFKSLTAWTVTRNTIGLNLAFIFTGLIASIIFSIMLYEIFNKLMVRIYTTVMFFPYFISWVLVGYLVLTVLTEQKGLLNSIILSFGGKSINFYSEPKYWPLILIIVNIWKTVGYSTLIFYAVLTGIDRQYFEAAAIDGASRIKSIWYISLPFIKPMAVILIILSIGNIFRADFGLFYFVTLDQGLLYPTTDVIDTYVFRALKKYGDFSMSTAIGLFQSTVGFIMIIITNQIVKKANSSLSLF